MKKLLTAVALAAFATLPAAAADVFTVDTGHSDVSFSVRHIVSRTTGRFEKFTGTINLDAAKLESSSVDFTVDTTSINTGVADRDKHLRSPDFFDTEKFPQITFKSSKVVKHGDNYDVTGTLTMHGVAKEVTLPVSYLGQAKDPWGNTRAGFSIATTINRKDFNIVWNKALDAGGMMLGDDVAVSINLEAVLKKP